MTEIILEDKSTYNYYISFLKSLSDLTNPEFPGKFWINENGTESYAEFGEMYNCFMSPCDYILKWKLLSEKQRENLQQLCDMLENYDEYLPDRKKTDEEIRDDPKWHKVRNYAQIVYEDLKNVKFIKISDG